MGVTVESVTEGAPGSKPVEVVLKDLEHLLAGLWQKRARRLTAGKKMWGNLATMDVSISRPLTMGGLAGVIIFYTSDQQKLLNSVLAALTTIVPKALTMNFSRSLTGMPLEPWPHQETLDFTKQGEKQGDKHEPHEKLFDMVEEEDEKAFYMESELSLRQAAFDFFWAQLDQEEEDEKSFYIESELSLRQALFHFFWAQLDQEEEDEKSFYIESELSLRQALFDFFWAQLDQEEEDERALYMAAELSLRQAAFDFFWAQLDQEEEDEKVLYMASELSLRQAAFDFFWAQLDQEEEDDRALCMASELSLRQAAFDFFWAQLDQEEQKDGVPAVSLDQNRVPATQERGDIVELGERVIPEYRGCSAVVNKVFEKHCSVMVLDQDKKFVIGQLWPYFDDFVIKSDACRIGTHVTVSGLRKIQKLNGLTGIISEHPKEGHPCFVERPSAPEKAIFTVCVVLDDPQAAGKKSVLLELQFLTPTDMDRNMKLLSRSLQALAEKRAVA